MSWSSKERKGEGAKSTRAVEERERDSASEIDVACINLKLPEEADTGNVNAELKNKALVVRIARRKINGAQFLLILCQ